MALGLNELFGSFNQPIGFGGTSATLSQPSVQGVSTQPDWNTSWNQGWNAGFNNPNGSPNQGGGFATGFSIGQQEYRNRQQRTTTSLPTGGGQPTQPTQPTDGGGGGQPTTNQGGGGGGQPTTNQGGDGGQPSIDYGAQARGEINTGYDAYFSQLDNILNQGLPAQRIAQEDIARGQYTGGVGQLGTQRTLGLQDLATQRAKTETAQGKTLNDISTNLRNAFQAGNTYLGARGAGDSSAANQYSYALTKLGSQQRGDVQSQYANIQGDINARESRLNEIYTGEVQNLASQRDQRISSIAQWFAGQQNALQQAQAQGQLSKGQDLASISKNLLNVALQQLQNVQTESSNRRSALEQWAMNNATNINQLKQNMQGVGTINPIFPQAQQIAGTPTTDAGGNIFAPQGYGSSQTKRYNPLTGQYE